MAKKDRLDPAVFVPAGEEQGKGLDGVDGMDRNDGAVSGTAMAAAEEWRLLQVAEEKEREEARRKLREGAKLTARERKLLEEARAPEGPGENFQVDRLVESLNAWWVNGSGENFQIRDQSTAWLQVPASTMGIALKRRGVPEYPVAGEPISRLDQAMMYVREHRTLDNAVRGVAGYLAGVHKVKGARVLIRQGPELIEPVEGEWPVIQQMIEGLLGLEPDHPDGANVQINRFHFWLSRAVENLLNPEVHLNSQILVLAGPADSGKSRLQHMIITPLLGGRSADPSRYLFGETSFNAGWIAKEHLLIEDPRPSVKTMDRVQFGQHLKSLCVNDDHSFHAKGVDEFEVDAQFVVSISINNDPDALRPLPPLTPDIVDKLILLLVSKVGLPMPTRTPAERKAFQDAVRAELPAYLHFLLTACEVPPELQSSRFGVKHYQEPTLKMVLWEDSPAAELLALIDNASVLTDSTGSVDNRRPFFETASCMSGEEARELFGLKRADSLAARLIACACEGGLALWVGTSQELQSQLETCQHRGIAKKLLDHNPVPRLLGRLAEDYPERIVQHRTGAKRQWLLIAAKKPDDTTMTPEF